MEKILIVKYYPLTIYYINSPLKYIKIKNIELILLNYYYVSRNKTLITIYGSLDEPLFIIYKVN